MSFFDRQKISETLLKTSKKAENENENTEENAEIDEDDDHEDNSDENIAFDFNVDDEFEVDILVLRNYSFIIISMNEVVFEMHELMQLVIRK